MGTEVTLGFDEAGEGLASRITKTRGPGSGKVMSIQAKPRNADDGTSNAVKDK